MLDRRDALKAMAGAVCSLLLPAPRRQIDLAAWCAPLYDGRTYDHTLPYGVADWVYATDGYGCVRLRPEVGDVVKRQGKIPPVAGLSWNHDRLRGWRPLPRLEPLWADGADCPHCLGFGWLRGGKPAIGQECDRCGGTGTEWVGTDYHISRPIPCRACKGQAMTPPEGADACPHCDGQPIGRFPAYVRLDGRYFALDLYRKARTLGAEYVHDNLHGRPSHPILKFRFDGGLGILMAADAVGVEPRLVRP